MSEMDNIMIFVEQRESKVAEVSLELICEGRRLADQLGIGVSAVVLGSGMKEALSVLGYYGCQIAYYIDDARLGHFTPIPYAKSVVSIIKKYRPRIVLFGATVIGRDIAPRVASELRCGLTADCTELKIGSYTFKNTVYKNTLFQIRPAFGGNIVATIVSPESVPSMATVREGVMKIAKPDTSRIAEIVDERCEVADTDFLTEIVDFVRAEKSLNLKTAQIVVSAGMGAASSESLKLVKELAEVLGGEVGGSRPVVDTGLLAKEHQVGQTGLTVRPTLYIACGISGQIQHRAGMAESKRIIAINSDPDAPIFKLANYGIVGDLNDVIPKMIKAYKSANA